MRHLPHWQQIPRLYRFLVISFAVIDVVILVIVASGLRSWFHGAGSVVQSVVYLLFLAMLFAHIPSSESPLLRNQRFSGTARIVAGIVILFLSDWILVGLRLTTPSLIDRPLAQPNVPEVRDYRVIGVINDVEIGLPSDTVTLVVD